MPWLRRSTLCLIEPSSPRPTFATPNRRTFDMNAPLSRVERLTQQILADRAKLAERAKNKPSRPAREDFDPYSIPYTRVIAGPDPGYLVRTPMRMGPVGFYISCQACGAEF